MAPLDACTTFCATLTTTVGPTVANYLMIFAVAGLAWWNTRQGKAAAALKVQMAATEVKASLAQASVAQIVSASIRPVAAFVPPASSSSSGLHAPVVMPELHPSTPTPDAVSFPKPPRMPSEAVEALDDDVTTRPERPSAKGRFT